MRGDRWGDEGGGPTICDVCFVRFADYPTRRDHRCSGPPREVKDLVEQLVAAKREIDRLRGALAQTAHFEGLYLATRSEIEKLRRKS
ncbi:MAG: hypothetical protein WCA31_09740 [Acidimicrobiales bacterium]